jgi:hypothetical protein
MTAETDDTPFTWTRLDDAAAIDNVDAPGIG